MSVRTKQATEEQAENLRARGFKTAAINGDIPQQARERTIDMLRDGKVDILVATDVAARGLDVERITLVVNYDIPHDTESYVHRIGRRSEEHTSELQSRGHLVCRLLLEENNACCARHTGSV